MTTRKKIWIRSEDVHAEDLPVELLIERLQEFPKSSFVNVSEDAIHVNVYRYETDEELARRIEKEKAAAYLQESLQREYYLKLKAKYDGT